MEDAPLAESSNSIARVAPADEKTLLKKQDKVIDKIEKEVLDGEELDVRYQFTYLTNSFSIETEFGNLEEIAVMDNVKSVFIMPIYEAVPTENTAKPNTAAAGNMTGVHQVWEELGYTGVGMKIAVIDTGLDLDHPAFAAEPETTDDSMTIADIDAVLKDLNAYAKRSTITGKTLYRSAKVPYAFNYVDNSLTADHSADNQGDHGTHVAGIAAANAVEGSTVVGMAPDAQLIIMKVFGAAGGAYTDDIVAALEDAMTLGCDVVNLSLGSSGGFSSSDTEIDLIYQRLNNQDIIATISAGNEDVSSDDNMWGTDLNRTQNPDNATIGSPGTYVNATTIASADNASLPVNYFTIADGTQVFYVDPATYYQGNLMTDMLADQEVEYVIIDGLGYEEEFWDEEWNSLVEGKVAVIKRGELAFGEKIFNATMAGAIAAVIWDQSGADIYGFGMDTTFNDEYAYIPACMVSLEQGQLMADAAVKTLTVSTEKVDVPNATAGQMSSFSSWGVSPNLSLEPDLTGIGGSVLSCYDGGQYGLMSGTSMSAPQVAGVTALVMQRLQKLYPNAAEGSIRDLAEAMLMSFAKPIISTDSGIEASPRQQGAGLVDAYAAVTATSYLTVNGESPKAELGDGTSGNYQFTFKIHNISNEAKTYTLDSSLMTEDHIEGYGMYWMAGYNRALSGSVTFDKETVTVPAGGTSTVTVSIKLSDADKAYFDKYWENGGYVDGFVYLTNTTAEGAIIEEMSLPFLGFYGDWTQAPVFDTAYWYDNSFWGAGNGWPEGDEYWHIMWTNLAGTSYVLGFNPYSGAMVDNKGNVIYDESHNVISPNGDGVLDNISNVYLSLLRNAKTLTFTYTNAATGEILDRETITNNTKTMFLSSYGQVVPWLYEWYGTGLYNFKGLANGTQVTLTIDATVDYGNGGNHSIEIPITIDTQAAELVEVYELEQDGFRYLAIESKDNTALAAAYIMNPAGTQIYGASYDVEMLETEDGTYIALFDITAKGTEFLAVLCDYAANESYFEVTYNAADGNLPQMDKDLLYAYRVFDDAIYSDHMYGWVALNKPAASDEYVDLTVMTDDYMEYAAINAAEYVDGKIFAVDAVYNLVVMDPGLFNRSTVRNLGMNVLDMSFDDSTDTMYVLGKDGDYASLYTMDLTNGELTKVKDYGSYSSAPYAIADDDNGTLYAIKHDSSGIYTLDTANEYAMVQVMTTVDGAETALNITDSDGNKCQPNYAQGLTYANGKLYWAYFRNLYNRYLYSDLITIDTTDWSFYAKDYVATAYDEYGDLVDYNPMTELVGLMTLTDTEYKIPAATALTDLLLSDDSLVMTTGQSFKVSADPLPWNYEISAMTWTSSDESVATVSGGHITGIKEGTATITVNADGIEKTIKVTVVDTDTTFSAYNYYSGDGYYGYMVDVDLGTMNYTLNEKSPVDWLAGDYNGHDGYFYGYTQGGQFWRYDMEKNEAVKLGEPIGIVPTDMAYDYSTGLMYAATIDNDTGLSGLHHVNLKTGELSTLYMDQMFSFVTLACDTEGNLYTLTGDGMLIQFPTVNGNLAGMNFLMEGVTDSVYYMQSMCWDHENDVLLWAYCEGSTIVWINPDPENGYAISLGDPTESGLLEFVGLYTVPAEIPELDYVAVQDVTAEDMTILAGITKAPYVTINPLNATVQTVTLTSSDESIVKVNADGTLTGVAEGTTTVTGTVADNGNTYTVTFNVTVIEAADDVYGMVLTDMATYGGQYWVRLYAQDPSDPDIMDYTDYIIYAEEVVDGKLYAMGFDPNDWSANWQYFVMDPVTHVIESQVEMREAYPFIYDLTYDYATATMFAEAGPSDNASDLYIFDMETGELTLLMQHDQFFMSLASAPGGKLYAIEPSQEVMSEDDFWDPWAQPEVGNATLYVIDPIAETIEVVGDTGVKSNSLASMSYDYDTNRMYWTGLYNGGSGAISGLYLVDLETGAASNLGAVGEAGAQISGLYILSENLPAAGGDELMKVVISSKQANLSAGATTELAVTVLPGNLNAEVVWSSSDESIATVDENGVVTAVAQGQAVITATVTCNGVTMTASCTVSILDADAAFLTYNLTDAGWATINRADGSVTNLTEGEAEAPVAAIASIGNKVYGFDVENNFFVLDTDTYERTVLGNPGSDPIDEFLMYYGYGRDELADMRDYFEFEVRDMAFDANGKRLLVLGNVYGVELGETNDGNTIYEVNLADGSLTKLHRIVNAYYDMAMTVDADGNVYYYTCYSDHYYKVDLTDGTETAIVSLQSMSYYGESMYDHALYFDEMTGLVYHLFTSNGLVYKLFSLNPGTGSLSLVFDSVGEVYYDDMYWADIGDAFAGLTFVVDEEIIIPDPEDPTEPEQPAEPETPTEPEQPTEPETPTEPEQPTEAPTQGGSSGNGGSTDTGDNNHLVMWMTMIIAAATGMAVLFVNRKKWLNI